jgi:hypothetical protein
MYALLFITHKYMDNATIFQDLFALAKWATYIQETNWNIWTCSQLCTVVSCIKHQHNRYGRSFHWEYQRISLLISTTRCQMHTCEAMYIAAAATDIGERPGTMSSSTAFRAMCVAARWTMLGRPVSKWQQETLYWIPEKTSLRWMLPYTSCWSIMHGCSHLLKLPCSIKCNAFYFLQPCNTYSGYLSCRCTKFWLKF